MKLAAVFAIVGASMMVAVANANKPFVALFFLCIGLVVAYGYMRKPRA